MRAITKERNKTEKKVSQKRDGRMRRETERVYKITKKKTTISLI